MPEDKRQELFISIGLQENKETKVQSTMVLKSSPNASPEDITTEVEQIDLSKLVRHLAGRVSFRYRVSKPSKKLSPIEEVIEDDFFKALEEVSGKDASNTVEASNSNELTEADKWRKIFSAIDEDHKKAKSESTGFAGSLEERGVPHEYCASVASDILYLRTRSRWEPRLENALIEAAREGKPVPSEHVISGEWPYGEMRERHKKIALQMGEINRILEARRDSILEKYPNHHIALNEDGDILIAEEDGDQFSHKLWCLPDSVRERVYALHTWVL